MTAIEEVDLKKILPLNGPSINEVKKYLKKYSDEKIVIKCYQSLYDGKDIPLSDIEKITFLISEFLDSIHNSREEDS